VNFYLPAGLAAGPANVTITSAGGVVNKSALVISPVAPSLYIEGRYRERRRRRSPTTAATELAFSCSGSDCTPNPIDVSAPGDTVYLLLYGTGFRNASNVEVQILRAIYPVTFFGAQGIYIGLDQIILLITGVA
jgi:uncharacterized protein (TIGR03437 family)